MLGQFTDIFATSDINIANMVNKSKGDYAYSLFDLDSVASEEVLDKIRAVEGVLRVRVNQIKNKRIRKTRGQKAVAVFCFSLFQYGRGGS